MRTFLLTIKLNVFNTVINQIANHLLKTGALNNNSIKIERIPVDEIYL